MTSRNAQKAEAELSVQQLQKDLDKYRAKAKQQRYELASKAAQLKECRARYLALQARYGELCGAASGYLALRDVVTHDRLIEAIRP